VTERRQLVLILAGAVALMAVGIAGAALFPEKCTNLERLGALRIEFSDAVDALPVDTQTQSALERIGEQLEIGSWAGAVAVPEDARILPSQSGLFVVTDTDVVVLRPLIGVTSAARDWADLRLLPSTDAYALMDAERTIAVFDGEYEQERCGTLDVSDDTTVLELDRGFAVTVDAEDQGTATLRTMGEDVIWTAPLGQGSKPAAMVEGDHVTIVSGGMVTVRQLRTGEVTGELELPSAMSVLDEREGRLLLLDSTSVLHRVTVTDGVPTIEPVEMPARASALGGYTARLTPRGVIAVGDGDLRTDRGLTVDLPPGLTALTAEVSQSGFVGVLVVADSGEQAVLFWGPDNN
jgi:hypothetical protein